MPDGLDLTRNCEPSAAAPTVKTVPRVNRKRGDRSLRRELVSGFDGKIVGQIDREPAEQRPVLVLHRSDQPDVLFFVCLFQSAETAADRLALSFADLVVGKIGRERGEQSSESEQKRHGYRERAFFLLQQQDDPRGKCETAQDRPPDERQVREQEGSCEKAEERRGKRALFQQFHGVLLSFHFDDILP